MSLPLTRYLKDFSQPAGTSASKGMAFPEQGPAFDIDFAAPEPEPVDIDAERRAAYAEGYEVAERDLRLTFETERQALVEEHARALDAIRQKFEAETARALADGLHRAAGQIALAVSEQAAAAVAPFLSERVVANAVGDLAEQLSAAILCGEAGTISVSGPGPLFEMLREALGDDAHVLHHIEADDLDLTVDIGGTALVTRISAWTASLKKVLG
ncbi:GTPase [Ciceribacter ferrooxidans]|uniref:GTPase n=1 Tax=Ciceribacter ferrooxidans TaxID=2509717 RepID=A0A4Q2T047_9HYPH|nr:GTPase [Ciceribacter ferrooxidans]RYC10250.1 GTPase [Ciceribacter ferrooxidans]